MSDEDAPQKVRSVTLVALPPELDDEEEEVPTKLDVPRKMPSQTPSPAPSPEPEPISESMRTPTPAPATGRRPKKAKGAPAPAPRTSWASWIMLFLLIAGVVFVGVMVFGIFGGALGVKFIMDDEVPIAPAPAPSPGPSAKPEPKPAPAEPAPSVAPEPKVEAPKPAAPAPAKPAKPTPAGGGTEAKFVSAFPNTKKMTVRCTNGEGNGVGEAVVTSASPGDCRVTAIDKERNRVNATVKGAKAVTYTCFENGEETCK